MTKHEHTSTVNGFGILRSVLEKACLKTGGGLSALTVLSPQVDPYRLDTPSGHRDGQWVAEQIDRAVRRGKTIHWRGLLYVLVSTTGLVKSNGEVYRNTNEDWERLSSVAGKAARWLGYVPFDKIADNRNAEPCIHHKARVAPEAFVSIGIHVDIPDADDLEPRPMAAGFDPRQAYGRKLQAFKDLVFPKLKFEVVPVALTLERLAFDESACTARNRWRSW